MESDLYKIDFEGEIKNKNKIKNVELVPADQTLSRKTVAAEEDRSTFSF